MEENAKKDWEFHFVEKKMTDEDEEYYKSLGIRGMYTGRPCTPGGYWTADREKGMYLTGNECLRRYDGEEGPDYWNFIYKDKISAVGIEYSGKPNNIIYHIKRVILASELKDEKEYVCEAIIQAVSALGHGTAKACEGLLEKIEYFT